MQRRRYSYISALAAIGLAAGLACAPAAHAAGGDPLTMTNGFYVNPDNSAAVWAAAHPTDGREPAIESAIANEPDAVWFTGGESAIAAPGIRLAGPPPTPPTTPGSAASRAASPAGPPW